VSKSLPAPTHAEKIHIYTYQNLHATMATHLEWESCQLCCVIWYQQAIFDLIKAMSSMSSIPI